jgi:hypothetical protein
MQFGSNSGAGFMIDSTTNPTPSRAGIDMKCAGWSTCRGTL